MSAAISTTLRSDGEKAAAAKRPTPLSDAAREASTSEIEDEIGEGDPAEEHRQVELLRVGGEARRQREGQPRHGDLGERW